ncbi:thiamine phosphate synthase [Intestinimonas massiliensis (ex Afouda et al. 2020)]|uniref:thiamine phosphate synthase n=1 Tax=Intestinimonas massiliensis (ex Afouda et al. 2020) TaxID=1673721 RepID=UPI00102F99BF|nr:thiamine phosphate synthase [Intestinimonas massiliensis (ex Afouda et al. 2020)]
MKKLDTTLYLVTDSTGLPEEVFLEKVERALQGGVTFLQLREKERSTRAYIHLAREVHALARRYQVPLVVDDRVDVALAAETDGVHVGQTDMPVELARKLLGPDRIVGATAKTVPQALEAWRQGADYLGVGAIYPTTTKVVTVLTSTETLGEICKAVPIPVNAIGGLNRDNLGVLKGIPIGGICVVSAIMKADDPRAAAEGLRQAFDGLRKE